MKIIITTPIMYLFMLPVDNKVKIGLEKLKDGLKKFMSFVQIHFFMSINSSYVICIFTLKV